MVPYRASGPLAHQGLSGHWLTICQMMRSKPDHNRRLPRFHLWTLYWTPGIITSWGSKSFRLASCVFSLGIGELRVRGRVQSGDPAYIHSLLQYSKVWMESRCFRGPTCPASPAWRSNRQCRERVSLACFCGVTASSGSWEPANASGRRSNITVQVARIDARLLLSPVIEQNSPNPLALHCANCRRVLPIPKVQPVAQQD